MILRDYQLAARTAILDQFKEVDSTLAVLPTGAGKTVLFADLMRCFFPRRSIIVAHRRDLIFQARDKIQAVTGLPTEIEMAEYQANGATDLFKRVPVIISTVQTLCGGGDGGGRIGKFDPMQFGLLVCDESHHSVSPQWKRIISYFRTNPKLKVLGVTATPDRADEEALGQIFETVAFDYELLDAIHDGWLVDVQQQMVNTTIDYSSIRTTAGDLNGADLAAVLEAEKALHEIAGPTIEIIGNRRTLCFTSSVKHAEQLAQIFNRHRPGMASWVCGKTDKDERAKINADFHAGRLQVLCNCGTHTEGFDSPGVEVVAMARPTKSRSLYAQMVGRSTRPLPGVVDQLADATERRAAIAASAKPHCLVIDFVGNAGRHKLITSADILGGKVSEEAVERAITIAKRTGRPVPMSDLLSEQEEEIKKEREQKRLEEEARKSRLIARAKYSVQTVNPFDVLHISPAKPRGWDTGKQLSEKQRAFLRRSGIDPDALSFTQAKQLIGEIIGRFDKKLCTYSQAKVLSRFGYSTDVSFEEASRTIDALAKNHWRRPSPEPVTA